jgi:transcriptional regulator with XRE-family HTH domain
MTRHASTTSSVFADNLRAAQTLSGVTNEALARQIDVGLRDVQRWRAGTAEPRGHRLVALADALGHDSGWFYTDHQTTASAA